MQRLSDFSIERILSAQLGRTGTGTPLCEPPGLHPPGLHPPGLHPPGLHPPGLHPPGLHPPGLHPPGLHPPGLHPPGLHPPGLHPPGLHPPGLHPLGLHPPGLHPPGLHPPGLHPPVPWAVLAWLPVPNTETSYGEQHCTCGPGFRCSQLPVGLRPGGMLTDFGLSPTAPAVSTGWFPPAVARPKVRVRTQFTDAQTDQLEALMERDQYPTAGTRSQMARRIGLSEETVRVWFKNRRARRKQQRVHLLSIPPSSLEPDRKSLACFL